MKLILTGATGFVGGEVLRQALADPSIEAVTVLTRRPLALSHPKLVSIAMPDFLDYSGLQPGTLAADACIWCLGPSQTAVSRDDYVRMTHDFTLAGARAMLAANPNLRFCFLSGSGADPDERSRLLFGRIKGRTEKALAGLSPRVVSFRPAFIRARPGQTRPLVVRLFVPVANVVDRFTDGFSVDVDQLAKCLIGVAKHGTAEPVLDNAAIRGWS